MSLGVYDSSDGEVSPSDGELAEELDLHRVCEFFVCCTLVVTIAFTTGEAKNATIASDYPSAIFTAEGVVFRHFCVFIYVC